MNRFRLTNEMNLDITVSKEEMINAFHCIFYANETNPSGPPVLYNGVPIHKNPLDMFNYQQILFEQCPDYIIECGAYQGGSTLFFADTLNTIGKGKIISIDICEREEKWYPKVQDHERTILLKGSSVDKTIVNQVKEMVTGSNSVFVILDSLHTKAHVLKEMESYAGLLAPGNYMIVEDSNLNGHPLPPQWHTGTMQEGGPFEAIQEYMLKYDDFIIDNALENRFLFSYAPSGYLKKKHLIQESINRHYNPSPLRKASNMYYQRICENMEGDVINIGSSNDIDKMGGYYRDYFKKASSYTKLDFSQNSQADIIGNIEDLRNVIPDESYDVIFCIWVLEHVNDVRAAISELHRILRKNGRLILGLPLNLEFHAFPHDYHRYTIAGIHKLMKGKFKILEIEAAGPDEPYVHDSRLSIFGELPQMAPNGYMGVCQKI